MAQKNAAPDKRQAALIWAHGLDPRYYTVMRELNYSVFLKDRRDGSVKIIDKGRIGKHGTVAQ